MKNNTDKTPENTIEDAAEYLEEHTHGRSVVVKGANKKGDASKDGGKKGDIVMDTGTKSDVGKDSSRKRKAKRSSRRARKREERDGHGGTSATRRKRAKPGPSVETEEQYLCRREVRLNFPEGLKRVLTDDWDMICRQGKLITLPAAITVSAIFEEYLDCKFESLMPAHESTLRRYIEAASGMKTFFDTMLCSQLLYKSERPQYEDAAQQYPDITMSQVYGYPHLIRMFIKLREMLAYAPLGEQGGDLVKFYAEDVMKYLDTRVNDLFSQNLYETAPPEYHRRVALC